MYKKLNQLSFVIGLFFFLISLILFGHILFSNATMKLNFYTAIIFLIFGIAMMVIKNPSIEDQKNRETE